MQVVAKIEYYMRLKKLSNEELYKMIPLSKTTYYSKKKNESNFTVGELVRIADILEVDLLNFFKE